MGLGISLVMSVFNRTTLFQLSCSTWVNEKTWPDEILIVNDGGTTDLEDAVNDLRGQCDIPITYVYRTKRDGHGRQSFHWSNPAIPHNYLVKQAKGPVVVIIDPEIAFISDGLPVVYSWYHDEDFEGDYPGPLEGRRRSSLSAGTCYSIQTEFMHIAGTVTKETLENADYVSTNPASHQVILRHGPAHGYRAWWKERYIELGGKDERYLGWGYEDLDLCHRNWRSDPPGGDGCDHRIEIIEYGHGTPWMKGDTPQSRNRELWATQSPEDGIANRGKEWGIISP